METATVIHPFEPVWDERSRILILGSFPSVRSRMTEFYYGHPQNRFWPLLARLYGDDVPQTNAERRAFVLRHGIALWDVLASCTIAGADDASIRRPVANDLRPLLETAQIRAIFTTGTKAHSLYQRYCREQTGMEDMLLPSTSPANCRISQEQLVEAYRIMLDYL